MIHKFRIPKSEGNVIQVFKRTLQGGHAKSQRTFQPSRPLCSPMFQFVSICLEVSMNVLQRVKRGSFLPLSDLSKATVQDFTPGWQIGGTTRPESGRWKTKSQVSGKDTEKKHGAKFGWTRKIYLWTISEQVLKIANKKCNSWILRCCVVDLRPFPCSARLWPAVWRRAW